VKIIDVARKTANNIRAHSINLADSDIDAALAVANCYGEFLRLNHIGVFADIPYEEFFSQKLSFLMNERNRERNLNVLHLMTTPLGYGGHTRVVERLIIGGLGDGLASLDKIPNAVIKKIPGNILVHENLRDRSGVKTIQNILKIGSKYNFIVMHIHPDDIYSAIAAALLKKLGVRIYFYNHSDHSFSFGYYAAEKVLEISKYGWAKGEKRGITDKQTFVGIPIPFLRQEKKNNIDAQQPIRGIFSGSAGKFHPWGKYDAQAFLNHFFYNDENSGRIRIYVCGSMGKEKYWRTLRKNALDNIEFIGRLTHDEYIDALSSSDFYIDSFPQGNGTGFTESVMLGIPSFGMDLLAGCSAADILRSNSEMELISQLNSFIADMEAARKKVLDVREIIIRDQSVDSCITRIKSIMLGGDNINIPSYFDRMMCMDDFWENFWVTNGRVLLHIQMLSDLKFSQKIKFLKCWFDVWPYHSTLSIIVQVLMVAAGTVRSKFSILK
jgi:glycosyltransferase involved in cell wall biosynthesis